MCGCVLGCGVVEHVSLGHSIMLGCLSGLSVGFRNYVQEENV